MVEAGTYSYSLVQNNFFGFALPYKEGLRSVRFFFWSVQGILCDSSCMMEYPSSASLSFAYLQYRFYSLDFFRSAASYRMTFHLAESSMG
uniref:Uncharacterized protein n=1 Tax=Raphanus sativus TaxID=3726 RepID=A0A650GCD0_RAPSA|nr:hypothetical protein [Raphanus sativus]